MCCALALAEFAEPSTAAASLAGAADWVVGSQRPDGSWGRWDGTVEETAYAMHVLPATGRHLPEAREAAHRGYAYLMTNRATDDDGPALWHDKDLYRPTMIVRAAVLAALHVAAGIGPARRPRGLPTCPV
jgi:hypothetical protein